MPHFSQRSLQRLNTCNHHLVILFTEVIKYRDCSVLCGYRGRDEQEIAFATGASLARFGASLHNVEPAMAVDVAPFIDGGVSFDTRCCYAFGGFVMGLATAMNLGGRIRWGGDWDGDGDVNDQRLRDLVHFELVG